jgi:hypothetical protein
MEKPELVVDSDGHAVLKDGMPLYKYADGTEQPLDLAETLNSNEKRVRNLEDEKDRHFNDAKTAKNKLEAYGEITVEVAKENAETLQKIDANELIDKHGLATYEKQWKEQVLTNVTEEWETKQAAWKDKEDHLKADIKDMDHVIRDLSVNNKLSTHPYFAGDERKTVYSPQAAAKIYGDRFKVERDGRQIKVHALDKDGKILLSKKNHGAPAEFHEAVELIVQADADGSYDIFRSVKAGGPAITGNMSNDGVPGKENASSFDMIKAGLKRHQRSS